jgi:hypothetical protein
VKPDRLQKHKGGVAKAAGAADFRAFSPDDIDRAIKAQTRHKSRANEKPRETY